MLASQGKKFQVVHLAGNNERADALRQEYFLQGIPCCVKGFEERMTEAWTAADLVICRAGAATLAEQIAFEVPGILIPFPYASEQHQKKNALFMETRVQGGYCLPEDALEPRVLSEKIGSLLDGEKAMLQQLQNNIRTFKNNSAPQSDILNFLAPYFTGSS
jgi:UDP-N-acetylglucosamine--N-acetylmuramyl-(pentapeptide) pyrophosphoryl-undecaprenol N-acetylglucosamine transferase